MRDRRFPPSSVSAAFAVAALLLTATAAAASGPYQVTATTTSQDGNLVRTEYTVQVGPHPLDRFKMIRLVKDVPQSALRGSILFLPPLGPRSPSTSSATRTAPPALDRRVLRPAQLRRLRLLAALRRAPRGHLRGRPVRLHGHEDLGPRIHGGRHRLRPLADRGAPPGHEDRGRRRLPGRHPGPRRGRRRARRLRRLHPLGRHPQQPGPRGAGLSTRATAPPWRPSSRPAAVRPPINVFREVPAGADQPVRPDADPAVPADPDQSPGDGPVPSAPRPARSPCRPPLHPDERQPGRGPPLLRLRAADLRQRPALQLLHPGAWCATSPAPWPESRPKYMANLGNYTARCWPSAAAAASVPSRTTSSPSSARPT